MVLTRATAGPTYPAIGIQEVNVADLAVQQTDTFPDLIRNALADEEVTSKIFLTSNPVSYIPHP
ncbi:hypothetical protein RRF57_010160 [Xylaria bambusicola]|uniref:Uncharacterized protein n=1 Tax=Xylaria bambusicola TaxID=326684 RepID=A0AAN7Z9D6_9PEZI